jgi:hypothetical protein
MVLGRIFDIMAAIVVVGGVTVAVSSPNTAGVANAFGNAFANSLRAAMGK